MMKKFILSVSGIVGLLFSVTVSAQKIKQSNGESYPAFSLHTSLTSYFDYDAGVNLGIGYRWNKHFSASISPTWIFYSFYSNGSSSIIPSGVRVRADVKYFFKKRRPRHPDFYIAPEFHYKQTNTKKEAEFGINCVGGQCAYIQNAVYSDIKKEIGGLVKTGIIFPLRFVKNHRWLLDMYIGIGGKQYNYRETDLPTGGSFVNIPSRGAFGGTGDGLVLFPFGGSGNRFALPMVPAGFKLIFIL
jgi:Protein of unknown function (DUF3575)